MHWASALISFLLILASDSCLAYPLDYGPFTSGKSKPKPVLKHWEYKVAGPCKDVTGQSRAGDEVFTYPDVSCQWLFKEMKDARPSITVEEGDFETAYYLTITDESGNVVVDRVQMDGGRGVGVYSGFINEDNHRDFVIVTGGTGQGILGWHQIVNIVLSVTDSQYVIIPIESWGADAMTDFVDIDRDGRCEFIQTSFIGACPDNDEGCHSYWVHNLLRFRGTDCLSANNIDRRFPCWIWYTYGPNHKNTKKLTAEQKKEAWREQGKGEMEYDHFPYKALLEEQGW